jgi:hypothetical protein
MDGRNASMHAEVARMPSLRLLQVHPSRAGAAFGRAKGHRSAHPVAATERHARSMETAMVNEPIQEGFEVFLSDHDKAFGAVRQVAPHGKPEIIVYVENWGDFTVALDAVKAVHSQKVIVERGKLDRKLRQAIGHAHDAEDPKL